jgi:ribosomal protein L21
MFATVEAGGRQETVQPGVVVGVDHLDAEPGAEVSFD